MFVALLCCSSGLFYFQSAFASTPNEADTTSETEEASSSSLFDIHYKFKQIYPGLLFSKGITQTNGSFQGISRINQRKGDAYSYGFFFGFVFNEHNAIEFAIEQSKYSASITRFYNSYSTETEYSLTTRDYMLLYRFNLQRYFFKIGPALFTKRGSWSSKTYVSDTTTINDPSPSSANVFGSYISVGHLFKVVKDLHIGTELYMKYPFKTQWKGYDKFKIISYGLSISTMYLF